jgi:hypothetical protein
MKLQIAGVNDINATLLMLVDDTVYVSLESDSDKAHYYRLDPITSNLIYIDGDIPELTKQQRDIII